MLQSSSLHSFCPSLLLFFFLDASGHRILFVSSSPICFRVRSPCCLKLVSVLLYLLLFFSLGTFGTQSSPCFPPVSVLVSLVGSYSLPEFSFSGCLMAADSSCLSFVSMLSCLSPCLFYYSPPALSVLRLVALGTGLSLCPICFRARLSACSQLVLTLLSSLLLFYLGASGAQDAPCPLSVSVLVVLVVSPFRALLSFFSFFLSLFLSLSLSLALLLSRCLLGPLILLVCHLFPYVSSLFSPSCILVSLVLSKLYSLPIAILLSGCFGQNASPYLSSFVTFPYPLSTTCFPPSGLLILSPLPCFFLGLQHFGTEKRAFLLFPFFHYLFL